MYPLQQVDLVRQWTTGYGNGGEREFDVDRALYRASGESIERVGEVRRFFDVLCEVSLRSDRAHIVNLMEIP